MGQPSVNISVITRYYDDVLKAIELYPTWIEDITLACKERPELGTLANEIFQRSMFAMELLGGGFGGFSGGA